MELLLRINGLISKFYTAIKSYKYLIPISQILKKTIPSMHGPGYSCFTCKTTTYFLDAVDGSVEIAYFDA